MVVLISLASRFFVFLTISFFLFVLLARAIKRLSGWGLSRPLAALTATLGVACAFLFALGALYFLWPSLTAELPLYWRSGMNVFSRVNGFLRDLTAMAGPQHPRSAPIGADHAILGDDLLKTVLQQMGTFAMLISLAFLAVLFALFLYLDSRILGPPFTRLFPSESRARDAWNELSAAIEGYFVGNLAVIALSVPVFALAFSAFRIDGILIAAGIASVFNLVPFVGAPLAALVPTLNHLAHGGSLGSAASILAVCAVIHFLLTNLVAPKVIGFCVDLNATASLFALIVWGEIWGAPGLLLGIPLTATLKVLLQNLDNPRLQAIALILSDSPQSLKQTLYRKRMLGRASPHAVNAPNTPQERLRISVPEAALVPADHGE